MKSPSNLNNSKRVHQKIASRNQLMLEISSLKFLKKEGTSLQAQTKLTKITFVNSVKEWTKGLRRRITRICIILMHAPCSSYAASADREFRLAHSLRIQLGNVQIASTTRSAQDARRQFIKSTIKFICKRKNACLLSLWQPLIGVHYATLTLMQE